MPVTFAGYECVDPRDLLLACQDQRIPADPWIGRANLFRCPSGKEPGRGAVLMTAADLDRIDQTADHDLVFQDDTAKVTTKRLTITSATCVVPGTPDAVTTTGTQTTTVAGEPWRVYLVEVADRRHHWDRIPFAEAFNVRDAEGTGWLAQTLSGGTTPYTWDEIGNYLWDLLPADLPAWPGLGWSPHGTPENFDYRGDAGQHWTIWGALNHFLDRLAMAADYNPLTDTLTLVRIGSEPADETAALNILKNEPLTWDGEAKEGDRPGRPEKVRVKFLRAPAPTDGRLLWFSEDVTLAAADGVVADTFVQLEDDMTAQGSSGAPTNAATLTARAEERAADWLRKHTKRDRRLLRVYRDLATEPATVIGGTATSAAWEDRGNGLRAELSSGPDLSLERWRRTLRPAGGGGSDTTFLVVLTRRDYTGTFVKYAAVEVEATGSVTYAVRSGGRTFGFGEGQTPLYQQRNMNHPVVGESAPGVPNFVKKGSVVRVWIGPDGIYFFKALAPVAPLRRTGDEGTVGEDAFIRENRNDSPGAPTWEDGDAVEVVPVE